MIQVNGLQVLVRDIDSGKTDWFRVVFVVAIPAPSGIAIQFLYLDDTSVLRAAPGTSKLSLDDA